MRKTKFSPQEIKDGIVHGINNRHHPFNELEIGKGSLWNKCMAVIEDPDLMNKMIFCNDVLQIPPVKVFLSLPQEKQVTTNLSLKDRRFLTALFDYLFKFVFEYQEKHTKRIDIRGLGTAAYYAGRKYKVEVE